jgi:hypothetical protein
MAFLNPAFKRQFARCKAMSGVRGNADLPVERLGFSL